MSVVDSRVVQLLFDGAQFAKGVTESQKSLNTLDKQLNTFGGSSRAGAAVLELAEKFNRLGIFGVTAIQNIANRITNELVRAVKSVSVDQVAAGFGKYEEKIESVQTIMSATTSTWEKDANNIIETNDLVAAGFDAKLIPSIQNLYTKVQSGEVKARGLNRELKNLGISSDEWNAALKVINGSAKYSGSQMDYVSEQLQRLNWFTDETSYSFTDMTSNIGKFTSQGQSLSNSVIAMEGIAVWAAKSGQNAGSASRAMYNLSQALGVGAVKLMDWKSIENANMATAEFKEQAIKAAVACGTLTEKAGKYYVKGKNIEVTTQNFSQTLSEGWFTSKALMSVLQKYGGFADEIGKVTEKFEAQGVSTTDLLEGIDAIYVTAENGEKKIDPSNSAFQKWCEENQLSAKEITPYIEKLAGDEFELGRASFKAAQEAKTFNDAMSALKDGVSTAWMNLFESIFGNYEEAKKLWTDFANSGYSLFAEPINLLIELMDKLDAHQGFENFIEWFNSLGDAVDEFIDGHGDEIVETIANAFKNITWALKAFKNTLKSIIDPIKKAFQSIFPAKTGQEIRDAIAKFSLELQHFFQKIRPTEKAADGIQRTFQGVFAVFDILKTIVESVIRVIGDLAPEIGSIGEGFFDATGNIGDFIVGIRDSLKENDTFYKVLKTIANFVVPVFKTIIKIVTKVVDIFTKLFSKGKDGDELEEMGDKAKTLSERLEPLAAILEKIKTFAEQVWTFLKGVYEAIKEFIEGIDLSKIDFKEVLSTGIEAGIGVGLIKMIKSVTEFFKSGEIAELGGTIKEILDQVSSALQGFTNNVNAGALLKIAIAVLVLAAALAAFTYISKMDGVIDGLGLLVIVFTGLLASLDVLNGIEGKVTASATAILILSFAMLIMAGALAAFAAIAKMDTAFDGLILLASCLGILVAACKFLNDMSAIIIAGAFAILVLSSAMIIMAVALAAFAAIAMMGTAFDGIILMAGVLGMLVVACMALDKMSAQILVGAIAIIILSGALIILAASLAAFAAVAMMDTIDKGFEMLAGTLLVVVAALVILNQLGPEILAAAVALIVVSAALIILAGALAAFSAIAMMESSTAGFVLMAAGLAILVLGLLILSSAAVEVLIGAAALIAASVALGIFAVALIICSVAITAFSGALYALGGAIVGVATLIVNLIFSIIDQSAAALVTIADSIGQAVDLLFTGIGEGITALSAGIGASIALVGEGIASAIEAVIASIGEGIGRGLEGIGSGIEKIGESVSTVGDGIGNVGTGIQQFSDGVKSLKGIAWVETAAGLASIVPPLKDLAKIDLATVQESIQGIAAGINMIIVQAPLMGAAGTIGVTSIANALTKGVSTVSNAASNLSRRGATAAKNQRTYWYSAGQDAAQGFIEGVNSKITVASLKGTQLAQKLIDAAKAMLEERSPSRVFMKIGGYAAEGLAIGVEDKTDMAVRSVEDMALESIGTASDILANAIENDFSDPVIRPTLDLSNVAAGASAIGSMFGDQKVGVDGDLNGSGSSSKSGTTYTYVQNNYSPKSLNRMEIYRQTRNQINMKHVLKSV